MSNYIECQHSISIHGQQIPEILRTMFYPIDNTKEAHRIRTIDVGEV